MGQVLFRRPPVRTGRAPFSASGSPAVFHVQFAAGFRLPRARRISVTVSAFCITHTSWHRSSSTAWPPSPCGRLSRPPWRGVTPATTTGPLSPWDSRPVGDPAFVPVLRASATQAPRSSPRMPSLGIAPALEVRPHPTPCARSAGPRFRASFRRGQGLPRLEIRVQAIQL